MLKIRHSCLGLVALCTLLAGCSVETSDSAADVEPEQLGRIQAHIERVPDGVTCLRLLAHRAEITVDRRFDVTPGARSVIDAGGLPSGNVELSAAAYTKPCGEVGPSTPLAWVAEPVNEWLAPNETTKIVFKMRPAAQGEVWFDFPEYTPYLLNNCTSYTDMTAKDDPRLLFIDFVKSGDKWELTIKGRCMRILPGQTIHGELFYPWLADFMEGVSPAYPASSPSDRDADLWSMRSAPVTFRMDKPGHYGWYLNFDPSIAGAIEVVGDAPGLDTPVVIPPDRRKIVKKPF